MNKYVRPLLLSSMIFLSGSVFGDNALIEKKQGVVRATPTGQALTNAVAAAPVLYGLLNAIVNSSSASTNTLGNVVAAVTDVSVMLSAIVDASASGSSDIATIATESSNYVAIVNMLASGTGPQGQVIDDVIFGDVALAAGSVASVLDAIAGRADFASGANIAGVESTAASIVSSLNLIASRDSSISDATLNNLAVAIGNIAAAEATILSNSNGN